MELQCNEAKVRVKQKQDCSFVKFSRIVADSSPEAYFLPNKCQVPSVGSEHIVSYCIFENQCHGPELQNLTATHWEGRRVSAKL